MRQRIPTQPADTNFFLVASFRQIFILLTVRVKLSKIPIIISPHKLKTFKIRGKIRSPSCPTLTLASLTTIKSRMIYIANFKYNKTLIIFTLKYLSQPIFFSFMRGMTQQLQPQMHQLQGSIKKKLVQKTANFFC